MAATIEVQRQQLFKASAVVAVCRFACASKFTGFDPEQLADALLLADDLIGDVAGALEEFTGDEAVREHADNIDPQFVVESLRQDAALLLQQHPQLHAVQAQLLRAAAVIERLACGGGD